MKKTLLSILISLASLTLSAQILEDEAKFAKQARGEAIFKLKAGNLLYTFPEEDGWYKARREVIVVGAALDGKTIVAGTQFYNEEEEVIGEALADVKALEIDTIEQFRGDPLYRVIIEGWIFETKLEEGSFLEAEINKILATKNRSEQAQGFKALEAIYPVEEREFGEFNAWVVREEHHNVGEKDFRLIMVFRGKSTPYAVITKEHEVSAPKIKDQWEDGNLKIIYLFKASGSQKEEIENILFTFLAL